jgi:transketolase C-terminal domain/subunit
VWKPIGVQDRFGETGPYGDILKAHGLDAASIAAEIRAFVKK